MARRQVKINPIRGERLKTLCKEQGITQAELSERIFLSQQTVSKIVQGKANLTESTAATIVRVFPGYRYDWIMAFDTEPMAFDSPLEFEKAWHRGGGGAHPPNNLIVAEARTAVALEKMNEKGWQLAVNLVETLAAMPDLQTDDKEKS